MPWFFAAERSFDPGMGWILCHARTQHKLTFNEASESVLSVQAECPASPDRILDKRSDCLLTRGFAEGLGYILAMRDRPLLEDL